MTYNLRIDWKSDVQVLFKYDFRNKNVIYIYRSFGSKIACNPLPKVFSYNLYFYKGSKIMENNYITTFKMKIKLKFWLWNASITTINTLNNILPDLIPKIEKREKASPPSKTPYIYIPSSLPRLNSSITKIFGNIILVVI